MYIEEKSVDDLLRQVIAEILKSGQRISPTRGSAVELTSILLCVTNPRARLSRTETKGTVFSCLGELLWYMTRDNQLGFIKDYISKYDKESTDGKTVYGGYGKRLFQKYNVDQIQNVIEVLTKKPTTRRAVIQLYEAMDTVANQRDVPCTCTLQFLLRNGHLDLLVNMRSNDAFLGLPHDFFAFTMIQEMIAVRLGVGLGRYSHCVGSLHLYDDKIEEAKRFMMEGWQEDSIMPTMPNNDPFDAISALLKVDFAERNQRKIDVSALQLNEYWRDLATMIQIHWAFKSKDAERVSYLRALVSNEIYLPFIDKRQFRLNNK